MSVRLRFAALLACALLASSCVQRDGDRHAATQARSAAGSSSAFAQANVAPTPPPARQGFASLPDRGELVGYTAVPARRDGAYTWHRAELSEAHALAAIASGHLRVTTPSGALLDFQYDRHVEHPSGDWTWIGHLPGREGAQAILTFGAQAAFGSIAQPGRRPLRLTVRDGASWLVETDPAVLAARVDEYTRPTRPDYHLVRKPAVDAALALDPAPTAQASVATAAATTTSTSTTVDVVIGYTPGFATALGGTSAALTRLNHLVDVTNAAYANSKVSAQVRLVHAMSVNYTETNSNDTALTELSGYDSDQQKFITPNAAFNALRAARETYGADAVALVRHFHNAAQLNCGIAWLLGGAKQGIAPGDGWDDLAYSVVSDGSDGGYYCADHTLAHELGHNMGSAHDRETSKGDDGVLDDPQDYGAYSYSFGYKTTVGSGNFYTVMAYGDTGQTSYNVFSNPAITFCGGFACGRSGYEDNARSLRSTIPAVATFRPTMVPEAGVTRVLLRELDTNGNRKSDLLFFNHAKAQLTTWFMNGSVRSAYSAISVNGALHLVDAGDFDGNRQTDLLFVDATNHRLYIALSNGSGYDPLQLLGLTYSSPWAPLAVADINGNGKADILLRNASTGTVVVWYMSSLTRVATSSYAVAIGWDFVGHGSLDGDARRDLLWTNNAGQLLLSTSTGTAFTTQTLPYTYNPSDYGVAGVADVSGNGKADIVLARNDGTRLVLWYMDGGSRTATSAASVDPAYRLVGKGDFDGNGRGDLVTINPSTRQIRLLLSTGTAFSAALVSSIPGAGADLMDVQ